MTQESSRKTARVCGWFVVLAMLVAIPAAQAQDSQSGTGQAGATPAATTSAPNSGTTTLAASVNSEPPLAAPVRQGFWGRMNPFARKKYVEGQLAPIRDRVNELDGLTADNAKAINDVDARAKAGIADAQSRAQKADDAAQAAGQQVQQDETQATQLNQQVTNANSTIQNLDQYQAAQTVNLEFGRGPAKLSADAQQQLDSFLQGLDSQKGYVVEVTAYSNLKGTAAIANSQQLADTVVRYMVLQHNLPLYRIYTMGLGNQPVGASATTTPALASSSVAHTTQGGTVEVKVLRNSVGAAGGSNSGGQ